ncbi:MAG: hypothetical protein LBI69_00755 [Puniceicoccales bacterium]|jgi:hypothetical protein|nr:hypothetical protein [Puniceicoccales bacterium]
MDIIIKVTESATWPTKAISEKMPHGSIGAQKAAYILLSIEDESIRSAILDDDRLCNWKDKTLGQMKKLKNSEDACQFTDAAQNTRSEDAVSAGNTVGPKWQ